jgi:hypothetical protein
LNLYYLVKLAIDLTYDIKEYVLVR